MKKDYQEYYKKIGIKPKQCPKYKNPEDYGKDLNNYQESNPIWIKTDSGSANMINTKQYA